MPQTSKQIIASKYYYLSTPNIISYHKRLPLNFPHHLLHQHTELLIDT